mgnify:CR=1 FL=1
MKKCTYGLGIVRCNAGICPTESDYQCTSEQGKEIISKHIYGQFAEHLGTCIYGGLWVGEDSKIPNTQGYRNDVLQALKDLKVPVLRWPGGCFADGISLDGWYRSERESSPDGQ